MRYITHQFHFSLHKSFIYITYGFPIWLITVQLTYECSIVTYICAYISIALVLNILILLLHNFYAQCQAFRIFYSKITYVVTKCMSCSSEIFYVYRFKPFIPPEIIFHKDITQNLTNRQIPSFNEFTLLSLTFYGNSFTVLILHSLYFMCLF